MLPILFAASLLASTAVATTKSGQIVTRGDGIIRSPLRPIAGPGPKLRVRQNEVEVLNQRSGTRYAVEIEIGTPPQKVSLIVDTGSPNTWVNPQCETSNQPSDCRRFPQFDYSESSSINVTNYVDVLRYGLGSARIQYVYETLSIGSATITDQLIGIALESESIPLGILGLSPPVQGVNEYPYILDTMVDQGLIRSRAFSLDLRGVDNPTGALIFGGIDTGKYIGQLAKIPMIPRSSAPNGADRYYITMSGVGLTLSDGTIVRSEEIQVPVFLDSGSTLSHLPRTIWRAFGSSFPEALLDEESGMYIVPCAYTEAAGSIDFYFSGKIIRVSLNEFIWRTGDYCVLGVMPDDEEPMLGDTFLRAAYVVYDQDNRNLHLAQAADCDTNLIAIGSGSNAVPSSRGLCTELPEPTGSGRPLSSNLDVTRTRPPASTFTGQLPTDIAGGPGPAKDATRTTAEPTLPPRPTDGSGGQGASAASKGADARLGIAVAAGLGAISLLAWML
ncbi:aspartic peptidase domain-containing protein [Corynascus novoguineensis]|uniref:Aspartic peptidase domain-containing protein n=1 Tax=Corynascus novoguineensis TaxID=1126955 RepID=A0AAN7CLJ1_9PEZI|nr:aspartic peptidase domain-containing protein [Corynascus novoguineensis]